MRMSQSDARVHCGWFEPEAKRADEVKRLKVLNGPTRSTSVGDRVRVSGVTETVLEVAICGFERVEG